jgi:predicted aspartyl protease
MSDKRVPSDLPEYLAGQGFKRIALKRSLVGHFHTPGVLDGRAIDVLIDTGAASTVVSLTLVQSLGLKLIKMPTTGGGAGGANLEIYHVPDATLMIGEVKPKTQALFAMDLSHVNQALAIKGEGPVDVIMGVDVFEAQSAVIDYGSSSLYLKD